MYRCDNILAVILGHFHFDFCAALTSDFNSWTRLPFATFLEPLFS
jgi:hypothetical protein